MGMKNVQWERVSGPNLNPNNAVREVRNKTVFNSGKFVTACEKAGIPVSKRQASKFMNEKGIAYTNRNFV